MASSPWRAPIFRLLIPFATGIVIYDCGQPTRAWTALLLLGALLIGGFAASGNMRSKWKLRPVVGLAIFTALTALGILHSSLQDIRHRSDWIGSANTQPSNWLLEIRDEPKPVRSGWRITADLIAANDAGTPTTRSGGIHLYTNRDSLIRLAKPGSSFWIRAPLRAIQNKPNSSFDYARYCRQQKITHQTYLHPATPIQFQEKPTNRFAATLYQIQSEVRKRIYRSIADSSRAGLATALLIGWKGGLDPESKQQYTRTGTIHIIAISGLHVSLVFEILWRLLFPLIFIRGGRILREGIALASIWFFCLLAGGEASVLRAAIMFTAMSLGRWMERPVNGMQALGLSLLVLLLADPDWLFDPGFQLSHAAVAGILGFNPFLLRHIQLQNPLLKNTWQSVCLTLSATAATLPFTCYYFHQFPWLFLPANLIAVPLSSLALVGLFFLIPFSAHPIVATPIGWLTERILDGMNGWVAQLDRIPGSVWTW